ncbi:MAG: hypothetical protein Kow0029_11840 [Candidatus Rifleibacteriota bacterium]
MIELAKILRENELLIGDLYGECSRLFPDYSEKFRNLQLSEQGHAFLLEKILDDMRLNPNNWQPGKLSLKTAQLINDCIKQALKEIKEDKVAPRYALTFAKSIELSLSEKEFSKIFITNDTEFKKALSELENGFKQHFADLLNIEDEVFGNRSEFDFVF